LNKIDLKHARPEEVLEEIEHTLGIHGDEVLGSAARPARIPSCSRRLSWACPRRKAIRTRRLQAMVFDSHYDEFRGAISMCGS